jgi:hypothetical protein
MTRVLAAGFFLLAACSKPSVEKPAPAAPRPTRCGDLACERFRTAEEAFSKVLSESPAVLAIGETHAQNDLAGASTAKRFTSGFLPLVQQRASHLVLELWVANGSCGKKEKEVAARQKPVTVNQAPTDQNEFVALGQAAKNRGIEPHVLMPSCDEYAGILDAGSGDIDAMLSMIARLSARQIETLAAAGKTADAGRPMVLAYGGAMHNDLSPRPGREAWSFGPAMDRATGGRYIELDLIVPEAIRDTDAWRAQPWYPHFNREAHGAEALLITVAPRSYALIFPRGDDVKARTP